MATIALTSAFNTDNFWAGLAGVSAQSATTYEFQNSAGYFVRVTGTGLSVDPFGNPNGGTYTAIDVFADAGFSVSVATYSSATGVAFATYFTVSSAAIALAGADTITGSSGDDILNGYGGGDTIDGGDGSDTYVYSATGDVAAGETISDTGSAADTDKISVLGNVDFTGAAIGGIEQLVFTGADQTATFDASQLPAAFALRGAVGAQHVVVNNASSFDGSGWTIVSPTWNMNVDTITINGTSSADVITGTPFNDIINGLAGDDVIRGAGNRDTVDGGEGSDTYIFFPDDTVGEHINDTGTGGADVDRINLVVFPILGSRTFNFIGSADIGGVEKLTFNDHSIVVVTHQLPHDLVVNGAAGKQTQIWVVNASSFDGSGWTFIDWQTAGEPVHDYQHSDQVDITGSLFNDVIVGTSVYDIIYGDQGDDVLKGGPGDDDIHGDFGHDTAVFSGDRSQYTISIDNDTEIVTVDGPDGEDSLDGVTFLRFDDMTIEAPGVVRTGTTGADTIDGSDGTDTLSGGDGSDDITGEDGTDDLDGGEGNDTLDGGGGADAMDGGEGSDTYIVDDQGDTVTDDPPSIAGNAPGAGPPTDIDTVRASISYTLGADIENLELLAGALAGTGNGSANTINGNAANNTLDGRGGNDTLIGGDGDDTYVVDAEGDVVTEIDGEGSDTVRSSTISLSLTNYANVENLALLGSLALNLTGNGGINVLTGNAGANILDGGAGADTLDGGFGNDTYVLGAESDTLSDSGGTDTITSTISRSLAGYATIENLTLVGGAASGVGNGLTNTISGTSGANSLSGLGGNDTLQGQGGNDTLDGGTGKDRLEGGTGNDTYVIDSASDKLVDTGGIDTVRSTVTKTLATGFEKLVLISGKINGTGNAVANTIAGSTSANTLSGLGGNDTLAGGSGNDKLLGGLGNDKLTGGLGSDAFVFNTALSASANKDTITDFNVAADVIHLDNAIFKAIEGVGTLSANQFFKGAAAHDADDRIVYNSKTGALIYDANGNAAGGAIQIATLTGSPDTVSHADFFII